jgi:vancomycin resistance protein YoaR
VPSVVHCIPCGAATAGLPILERVNHAFAISYYTAPYGVPGVDATIYYPPVDFKFRNDTDAHILIQTEMVGTTLKVQILRHQKEGRRNSRTVLCKR